MTDKLKAVLKAELVAELKKSLPLCNVLVRYEEHQNIRNAREVFDILLDDLATRLLPAWTDHRAMEVLRAGKAFLAIRHENHLKYFSAYDTDGYAPILGDPASAILAVVKNKTEATNV